VKTEMHLKAGNTKVVLLILLVAGWIATFPQQLVSQPAGSSSTTTASVSADASDQDPNKPSSELNHHIAGYALIGIAVLVIAGQSSDRMRWLQLVWPFLFLAAGLFLAGWSDAEIWPRGNLSWTLLIHHDAEARQHKIFALLLIGMGGIEYLRARSRLNRFWRTWAFPLLALSGVGLLLVHNHAAETQDTREEEKAYVVSWLANETTKAAEAAPDPPGQPQVTHDHAAFRAADPVGPQPPTQGKGAHEGMAMHTASESHPHHMTPAMLKVEREHLWFAIIGAAVVVFKFIYDSSLWRWRFVPFLWPSFIALLGILLVFYTE
jgi:hypothetical protein